MSWVKNLSAKVRFRRLSRLANTEPCAWTTARYYTPSGRSIQAKGIEPDIEVRQAKLEVVESGGFGMTEAELKGALKNETAEEKKAEKDKRLSPEDLSDYQLLRAIDMVKALKLYSENDSGK